MADSSPFSLVGEDTSFLANDTSFSATLNEFDEPPTQMEVFEQTQVDSEVPAAEVMETDGTLVPSSGDLTYSQTQTQIQATKTQTQSEAETQLDTQAELDSQSQSQMDTQTPAEEAAEEEEVDAEELRDIIRARMILRRWSTRGVSGASSSRSSVGPR
jgi:hypothetical protein